MWHLVIAAAMNGLQAAGQYAADKAQSKYNRAMQKYRNTMTRLSDALNQNAITTNETLSNSAFARQAVMIKRSAVESMGSAEASAGAAGVSGRSVNQVVLSIQRSAAEAERERQIQQEGSWLGFDQQRRNSAMAAEMQQDLTYIPKPKASTYFMKAVMNTMGSAAGQAALGSIGGGSSPSYMSAGVNWGSLGSGTASLPFGQGSSGSSLSNILNQLDRNSRI